MHFGVPQLVITFTILTRFIFGALVAGGSIIVPPRDNQHPWSKYWGSRVADMAFVVVLIWGGFWG